MSLTIPAATVTVAVEDMTLERLCYEYVLGLIGDRKLAGKLLAYPVAALEVNPGLAAQGLLLPLGLQVRLPLFTIEPQAQTRRLWD